MFVSIFVVIFMPIFMSVVVLMSVPMCKFGFPDISEEGVGFVQVHVYVHVYARLRVHIIFMSMPMRIYSVKSYTRHEKRREIGGSF